MSAPRDPVVGQPLDRVDGRLKVTGHATYSAEFSLPGLLHAALVKSTIAHGVVLAIEDADARGMPGVRAIITAQNAEKLDAKRAVPQAVPHPTLQNDRILYNGQTIAIVVAETLDQAIAAAAAVRVRYAAAEAVTDMDAVLSQAYVPTHFRNGTRSPDSRRGDPERAFDGAAVKVEATYVTPVEHHNPMEPHATIARWEGDRLTVWTATQGISGAQRTLAGFFGLKPDQVRVICPYVGGGFGCKGNTWPPATLTAMAAREAGRPVKLVLSRADMYTSNGYRPRTVQRLRLAADADGRLVSLRHDGFSQMSAPSLGEYSEPVGLASEMLYACSNVAVSHRLVETNSGFPTYMRAPGEAAGVFALESAMDELAVALKIDPLELRLRNYAEADGHENKPFSSKKLRQCYAQAAEAFGWSRRDPAPRSMRDGRTLIGWGMATATYPANRSGAAALVRLMADGSAIVASGTQDLGTGTYTVMAQVAADALGLPFARVRFVLGDSTLPHAPNSGGSTTVASVSPAVQAACAAARQKLFALVLADPEAGSGLAAADLDFIDGAVVTPNRRLPIDQILARAHRPYVEAVASTGAGDGHATHALYSFGAQFAEVRVDPDLGEIRVSRWVAAFDAGRILNTKTGRSQLIGGITYGIGMALLEATRTDRESGRYVNMNLAEYLVPVHPDVPQIETTFVSGDDTIVDPLGARGIGELPMVGAAPAIANAVYHATGIRVRTLPIRIEDVLAST